MTTKIGLPENRKRLRSAGVQKAQNSLFDDGYAAGFKAGLAYNLNKTKENTMPTPEGVITGTEIWTEPTPTEELVEQELPEAEEEIVKE